MHVPLESSMHVQGALWNGGRDAPGGRGREGDKGQHLTRRAIRLLTAVVEKTRM